jgi:hypothetical protein
LLTNILVEKTNSSDSEYIALGNNTNVTNLTLVSDYSLSYGRVLFPELNITVANNTPLNSSVMILNDDFVSMNSLDNYSRSMTAYVSTNTCNNLKYHSTGGFPQTRAAILLGSTFTPSSYSCGSGLCTFTATGFDGNGYAVRSELPLDTGGGDGGRGKCTIYDLTVEKICPDNAIRFTLKEGATAKSGASVFVQKDGLPFSVESTDSNGEVLISPAKGDFGKYTFSYGVGACEQIVSLNYAECPVEGGCMADVDCLDSEYCLKEEGALAGECTEVKCDCGEVAGHACNAYECCIDEDCLAGELCDLEQHRCQFEEKCFSDADCEGDEYCDVDAQECKPVVGECGYAANHVWNKYECCDDATCPAGQLCDSHKCTAYGIDTKEEGYVGELHVLTISPAGEYELTVQDPSGRKIIVRTDAGGRATFNLDSKGTYTVSLARGGKTAATEDVDSRIKPVAQPKAENFLVTLFESIKKSWYWIVLVMAAIVIGYILYARVQKGNVGRKPRR